MDLKLYEMGIGIMILRSYFALVNQSRYNHLRNFALYPKIIGNHSHFFIVESLVTNLFSTQSFEFCFLQQSDGKNYCTEMKLAKNSTFHPYSRWMFF